MYMHPSINVCNYIYISGNCRAVMCTHVKMTRQLHGIRAIPCIEESCCAFSMQIRASSHLGRFVQIRAMGALCLPWAASCWIELHKQCQLRIHMNRDLPCCAIQVCEFLNPLASFPSKSVHRGFNSRSVQLRAMWVLCLPRAEPCRANKKRETNPCSAGSFLIYIYIYIYLHGHSWGRALAYRS